MVLLTTSGMGAGFTEVLTVLGTAITNAYTGNQIAFDTHSTDNLTFAIKYTKGGETNVDFQVEVWNSETGWSIVPYSYLSASSLLALTLSASGNKRWTLPRLSRWEKQVRFSVKSATAASANSTTAIHIYAQLGSSNNPIGGIDK